MKNGRLKTDFPKRGREQFLGLGLDECILHFCRTPLSTGGGRSWPVIFFSSPYALICSLVVVFLAQPGKVSPSWLNASGLAQFKAASQGPPA